VIGQSRLNRSVRNPLAPRSQWELGRITTCNRGDDLTRVVTIKTGPSTGVKLCFLPSRSISKNLKIPLWRAEFPLNVLDVTGITSRTVSVDYIAFQFYILY